MITCTRTYLDFLREDLNVAAQDAQVDEVMDAISSMLALGPRYTKEYVDEMLLLISDISTIRQSIMALGESTAIAKDSVRVYSAKMRYCDSKYVSFNPPLSGLGVLF